MLDVLEIDMEGRWRNMKSSLNKRKLKRAINKEIRSLNKNIYNDSIWMGRFVVHQESLFIHQFEDKSGLYAEITVKFIDKLTKIEDVQKFSDADLFFGKHFWLMNKFITEYCKASLDNPKDIRKISYAK